MSPSQEAINAIDNWFNGRPKRFLEAWIRDNIEFDKDIPTFDKDIPTPVIDNAMIRNTVEDVLAQYKAIRWWNFFKKFSWWFFLPLTEFNDAKVYFQLRDQLVGGVAMQNPDESPDHYSKIKGAISQALALLGFFSSLYGILSQFMRHLTQRESASMQILVVVPSQEPQGRALHAHFQQEDNKPLNLSDEARNACRAMGIDDTLPISWNMIRASYKRLCQQYHPDRQQAELTPEEQAERFKKMKAAYELLGDLKLRNGLTDESSLLSPKMSSLMREVLQLKKDMINGHRKFLADVAEIDARRAETERITSEAERHVAETERHVAETAHRTMLELADIRQRLDQLKAAQSSTTPADAAATACTSPRP